MFECSAGVRARGSGRGGQGAAEGSGRSFVDDLGAGSGRSFVDDL